MVAGIRNIFRALHHRNYRIFIAGHGISRIGTWMERTAVYWVVYEMTNSTFMLGLTVFAAQFPSFLFSLYGGVISDRHSRLKIVLTTQILSLIQAATLTAIVFAGHAQVWQILTLVTILGTINAFDIPARQSLVHQLVDNPADVPNAVALNSSIVNLARLLGPALSGLILSKFGAGVCFSINTASYLAVIVSLLFLRVKPQNIKPKERSNFQELIESFRYLKNDRRLGTVMLYMAIVSFLILPYDTLLPDFAKEVFNGDAQTYGTIASCIGIGALIGAFTLASLRGTEKYLRILQFNMLLLGVSLLVFSHLHNLYVAFGIAVVAGYSALTQSTICLTVIQTQSAPEVRGRMISLFAMAMFGMLPLGGLMVGTVSHEIGSPATMLIQGCFALVIALLSYRLIKRRKPLQTN